MERSPHAGSVTSIDTRDLARLYADDGPFLTLWASTIAETEGPAERTARVWRAARAEAASAGVPDALLDTVEPLFDDAHRDGDGLVVIGAGERAMLAESLPDPPRADVVRWAALPSLAPVIEHRQASRPHVVVLADRTGADIIAVGTDGSGVTEVDETHGQPVSRSAPGGWSQRRYQQRAENTWARNARAVAEEVEAAVAGADANVVVVAGDVRATSMLEKELAEPVRAMVRPVSGGRAADGSAADLEGEVDTVVRSEVAAETAELLRRFHEEQGLHPDESSDPAAVMAALSAGRVGVLLVHDDPDDFSTAWFDHDSYTAARDKKDLTDFGMRPRQGRLIDVAIRSALLAGAEVRIVPAASLPSGRVGALLRWS